MSKLETKENALLRRLSERRSARAPGALGAYPQVRMRRNRSHDWSRRLVAESRLAAEDLIWPVFVQEAPGESPVEAMPGVVRYGLDSIVDAAGRAAELGIPALALFPYYPDDGLKTADCAEAHNPENLICRTVRLLKDNLPDLGVFCDVALDGLVADGRILNDESVAALISQALAQAEAGCDVVAPSDMMDGRIGAIREGLDEAGFQDVKICAYSAKYASAFYGPFREAVGSGGALVGDKKTYQMDPANTDEALREVALDLQEGADMVMVKPGLPYLDVVRRVKDAFGVPTLAYNVSGEYAMLKAAALQGWIDNDKVVMESLMAFKRAGADAILTYAAPEAATLLKAG